MTLQRELSEQISMRHEISVIRVSVPDDKSRLMEENKTRICLILKESISTNGNKTTQILT